MTLRSGSIGGRGGGWGRGCLGALTWHRRAAVQPHAGSFVEFEDEIERLLDDTPGDGGLVVGDHGDRAVVAPCHPGDRARRRLSGATISNALDWNLDGTRL